MPESLEQLLWIIISVLFIGFVFVVILIIFPSPITWLCLGLLTGILLLYPVVSEFSPSGLRHKSRRAQNRGRGQPTLHEPITKQPQQLWQGSKQQQISPGDTHSPVEAPDVQNYVPPGLPPDLFL
jgi:hypothetical protein